MKKFFAANWIILVIGLLLFVSMWFSIRNNYIIKDNHDLQQQAERITGLTKEILTASIHGIDLGVRGFALTKDKKFLDPFNQAVKFSPMIFNQLDTLISRQKYKNKSQLAEVEREVSLYIKFNQEMIKMAGQDSMRLFNNMLAGDKGYEVWKKYNVFAQPLFAFEENLKMESMRTYQAAVRNNIILQIAILFCALPMLSIFVVRMRKERDGREAALLKIKENDKKYVFEPGKDISSEMEKDVSIQNVQKASEFIFKMSDGDFDVEWDGLNEKNLALNNTTLVGNLIRLRNRLKEIKQEDEKRNWLNEGLAAFSEIVRTYQHDMKILAYEAASYFAKHLKAQQAGLFVLEEENNDRYLSLVAAYAFSRKKFIEKRIEIGQGLVGQTFLEGEVVRLKEVPEGYQSITSGLGESTPKYVIVVPFKYDVHIPAIIELASFNDFEDHHILFLKRAGEHLASALINSKTTSKMKQLLAQASETEEQMRQREEELRQNMEELQATQEELIRKERRLNV